MQTDTNDELLVPDSIGEISVESDSEVVGVVALVGNDMLEEGRLMPENFRETRAEGQ